MVKYYMNNPCTVVREVSGEFSEVKLIPNWVDDVEGSQWCFGCQLGSMDGANPSHTCDDAQEIIDHINDSQASVVVMVENRLLHDEPIEKASIFRLRKDIEFKNKKLDSIQKSYSDMMDYKVSLRETLSALGEKVSQKESLVAKYNDELETLENDIDRMKSRKATVAENTKAKVGTVNIPIGELEELLQCKVEVERLESGGVDNWDWYSESLNPDGELSVEEEVENRLNSYLVKH